MSDVRSTLRPQTASPKTTVNAASNPAKTRPPLIRSLRTNNPDERSLPLDYPNPPQVPQIRGVIFQLAEPLRIQNAESAPQAQTNGFYLPGGASYLDLAGHT